MRLFGRFRCASANSRSAISLVAPASPKIGPVASASSLGPAPDSNSHPINFAICAMATLGIIWTIIIGFIAGVIAKFVTSGDNKPSGFILTTILGIVGAFVATYIGQAIGWYRAGQSTGLIGAVVGAIIILLIWGFVARRRTP